MFVEILLTMALDMSLPEFQPEVDISGNVIVSDIDDVSGETIALDVPIEEIPISDVVTEESVDNYDDSYMGLMAVNESEYLSLTTKRNCEIKNENGQYYIRYRSSYNYYIQYTLLTSGVTYNIDKNGEAYIGLSVADDSEVFLIDTQTYTPSTDIYIIQYHHNGYYLNVSVSSSGGDDPSGNDPDDPSGNDPDDPSGNDPDDPSGNDPDAPNDTDYAALIIAVNDVYKSVNAIALILMFMAFCPFLTKVVDKLMFRKED